MNDVVKHSDWHEQWQTYSSECPVVNSMFLEKQFLSNTKSLEMRSKIKFADFIQQKWFSFEFSFNVFLLTFIKVFFPCGFYLQDVLLCIKCLSKTTLRKIMWLKIPKKLSPQ